MAGFGKLLLIGGLHTLETTKENFIGARVSSRSGINGILLLI